MAATAALEATSTSNNSSKQNEQKQQQQQNPADSESGLGNSPKSINLSRQNSTRWDYVVIFILARCSLRGNRSSRNWNGSASIWSHCQQNNLLISWLTLGWMGWLWDIPHLNLTPNMPLIQLWCARSKWNMDLKIIFSS